MDTPLRLSSQRIKVLRCFEQSGAALSGADVMEFTGLASGSLYPILHAFEGAGLLTSEWETVEPEMVGRPRRRLYTLTAEGARAYQQGITELLGPQWLWGKA